MNELFVNIIKFENKLVHRPDLRMFFFSVKFHREAKWFVNDARVSSIQFTRLVCPSKRSFLHLRQLF